MIFSLFLNSFIYIYFWKSPIFFTKHWRIRAINKERLSSKVCIVLYILISCWLRSCSGFWNRFFLHSLMPAYAALSRKQTKFAKEGWKFANILTFLLSACFFGFFSNEIQQMLEFDCSYLTVNVKFAIGVFCIVKVLCGAFFMKTQTRSYTYVYAISTCFIRWRTGSYTAHS